MNSESSKTVEQALKGASAVLERPQAPDSLPTRKQTGYAKKVLLAHELGESVGDNHFSDEHKGYWDDLRNALAGCSNIAAEVFEELTAHGQSEQPDAASQQEPEQSMELRLHKALLRQHASNFDKLSDYLSWLCEKLLYPVLAYPQRTHVTEKDDWLLWRAKICDIIPDPPNSSKSQHDKNHRDRLDFDWITLGILNNFELRASLLALYFLCPKPIKSTRSDKKCRRPVFHALNDLCLHWRELREDKFHRVVDAAVFNWDKIKEFRGEARLRKACELADIDFDDWCKGNGPDPTTVVRRFNRYLTERLRVRDKRPRAQ